MAETFDPAKKDASITLSGGNLIMTGSLNGSYANALALTGQSTGLFYSEFTNGGAAYIMGLANASAPLNQFLGTGFTSVGYVNDNRVLINGAAVATLVTYTSADIIGMAVDLTHSKIWFRKNAGGWNNDILANQNPASNVGGISISTLSGGPYFPAGDTNFSAQNWTANFGPSYAQTPPSGFLNWDGSGGSGPPPRGQGRLIVIG